MSFALEGQPSPPKMATTDRGFSWSQDGLFAGSSLRKISYPVVAILLVAVHLASSQASRLFIPGGPQVAPIWPEAGLDLAVLLVFGIRYWPVLLAAYFASSVQTGLGWGPRVGHGRGRAGPRSGRRVGL